LGEIAWRTDRPDHEYGGFGTPTVAELDGKPQVLLAGATLIASYDPFTGALIWSCDTMTGDFANTITVADDLVFASEEGRLFGVRRVTGNVQWTKEMGTPLLRTPPVRGRAVFVSPQPAQLVAIDVNTGVQIYRYRQNHSAGRRKVEPRDRVFFGHGPTLSAFAPSKEGYALAWTFKAEGRIVAGPVVAGGAVYIVDDKGYVYRLEANDS